MKKRYNSKMEKEFTITWNPVTKSWLHKDGFMLSNTVLLQSNDEDVRDIIFHGTKEMLPDSVINEMREVPKTHKSKSSLELSFVYE